jgi:hypothetical protein
MALGGKAAVAKAEATKPCTDAEVWLVESACFQDNSCIGCHFSLYNLPCMNLWQVEQLCIPALPLLKRFALLLSLARILLHSTLKQYLA